MTDQAKLSLAEARARLRAIEATIEATLWEAALEETEALARYRQAREALEGLLEQLASAARSDMRRCTTADRRRWPARVDDDQERSRR